MTSVDLARNPLQSFWMAGFESACHINRKGDRLDMLASYGHDRLALTDYKLLGEFGMRVARDGVRWHLIDRGSGDYDFSSLLPMAHAARVTETQVAWNLLHYGYPDDLDIFSTEAIRRFRLFVRATARFLRDESEMPPLYTPVNEISLYAWAGCRFMYPFARGRDNELKQQLVRLTVAACEELLVVDPRTRFLYSEPLIRVFPPRDRPELGATAQQYTDAQFDAMHMIAGRMNPELGGNPRFSDLMGLNFYHANEWEVEGQRLRWEDEPRDSRWIPLNELLLDAWQRLQRPIVITETSHFGAGRARWIREFGQEVAAACRRGVPIWGLCIYPAVDRCDWEDSSHWHNSGLWDVDASQFSMPRTLQKEYAEALRECQDYLPLKAALMAPELHSKDDGAHP